MRSSHRKSLNRIVLVALLFAGTYPVFGKEVAAKSVSSRAERRSFYTAPPVIPHVVHGWQTDKTCLTCHDQIRQWRGATSMLTPHPEFSNCQQCHVQQAAPTWQPKSKFLGSSWNGLAEQEKGIRANLVAPPTIPHRYLMRENCVACHLDVHSNFPASVEHPKRSNCQQCHMMPKANKFILVPLKKATKQTVANASSENSGKNSGGK